MPVRSRRKRIGRRAKRHSLPKFGVAECNVNTVEDDTNIVNYQDDRSDNEYSSDWMEAWTNFYTGDSSTSSCPTSSSKTTSDHAPNIQDSDGFSADVFYVVLHKVYQYSPENDLDQLVSRLKSERCRALYLTLCEDIQLKGSRFHGLQYVGTDYHGIRFWQPYHHGRLLAIKYQLTITPLLKPVLYVHGCLIMDDHNFWTGLPKVITSLEDLRKLSSKLASWDICVGNNEDCYVSMVPQERTTHEGSSKTFSAYREDVGAQRGDNEYNSTVRAVQCSLLVRNQTRCSFCQLYRHTLRSKASRERRKTSFNLKRTTHKNMSKEKLIEKIDVIRCEKKSIQDELKKLQKKVGNTSI